MCQLFWCSPGSQTFDPTTTQLHPASRGFAEDSTKPKFHYPENHDHPLHPDEGTRMKSWSMVQSPVRLGKS